MKYNESVSNDGARAVPTARWENSSPFLFFFPSFQLYHLPSVYVTSMLHRHHKTYWVRSQSLCGFFNRIFIFFIIWKFLSINLQKSSCIFTSLQNFSAKIPIIACFETLLISLRSKVFAYFFPFT